MKPQPVGTARDILIGVAAILVTICIYAGVFTVGRHGATHGLNGFDQTAIRFVVSFVVLLPFAATRAKATIERLGWVRITGLMLLQGALYSAVFLGGLTFAPAAYGAALVPGLQPFVVMGLSLFVLGERPTRFQVAGLVICLVGTVLMILGNPSLLDRDLVVGIGLFLLAAGMWGGYTFALRHWKVGIWDALLVVALGSSLLYLPPYFAIHGSVLIHAPLGASLLQAVYQGVLVGMVAIVLFSIAIVRIGSTGVAAMTPAIPVLAVLFAFAILGERLTDWQWLGIVVVSAGLLLVQVPNVSRRLRRKRA